MQRTTNYNLKKPERTDAALIDDINDNMDTIDAQLTAPTGDSADSTTTFTTSDTADGSASSWTNVPALTSGETHKSLFAKMSQMFKNIRYLYKLLGTTDISAIGNGTVTGGLSWLNDSSVTMKGTLASTTTETQLLTLAPGVYSVWYDFSWLPKGAWKYGTLISYMSGTVSDYYGVLEYTDTNGSVWFRHHTRAEWHDKSWKCKTPRYVDFDVTLSGGSSAVQLNSNSGNVINQYNFLNAYVVDTNDVYLSIYTYANLVYARLLKYDGSAYTSGTYKIRAWYRD